VVVFPESWRKALFPNLAWRDQLVSYVVGFVLLVVIPCAIIKFRFKERLSDYGLGWPKDRIRAGWVAVVVLFVVTLPMFVIGTGDPGIQKEYPMFGDGIVKGDWGSFIVYELVHILFYVVIEFIFRGYLLFGLYGSRRFGSYAILIQMLGYSMWHIAKPAPEYIGALFFGVAVAAIALRIRSIWPIIFVHWSLNVVMDTILWLK
jgi:membrane protease YdiL (CAAX protease family)